MLREADRANDAASRPESRKCSPKISSFNARPVSQFNPDSVCDNERGDTGANRRTLDFRSAGLFQSGQSRSSIAVCCGHDDLPSLLAHAELAARHAKRRNLGGLPRLANPCFYLH